MAACCALLPSAFCCFTACVDVYGTHSNVHLRCFHTGKSAVMHATPKVGSVVIRHPRLVLCPHLPPWLNLPSLKLWPFVSVCSVVLFLFFICDGKVEGHCGISVFVLIVIQISASYILCENTVVGPEYTYPLKLSKVVLSSHTECQHASGVLYLFVILKVYNRIVKTLIIARKVWWKLI